MKKSVAGAALIAAVGFSALSAAPAAAVSYAPFANCDAAAAAGVYNIPTSDPRYTPALDSDSDGIGCESNVYPYTGLPVYDPTAPIPTTPQVEQMPVGGADTGVAVAPDTSSSGIAALGLAGIAAATGGVVIARRRTAHA